ncbi:MAG: menaquinone biosynthesis protein [Acidobacteria bacterium]|nr:menaquinone biosynthesis protein [Acidobacteriota bacterium]
MRGLPFRISIIEYLNAAPLNYGFKHGLGYQYVHLESHVPSACADQLRAGSVDAGIVSSIEYLRIPALRIVPGLCIASPKRVRSVGILSRVPPEEIRSLALDRSSRTSLVLAQLLLRERYGTDPRVTEMEPDLPAMLEGNDAAVLIGDHFMRARREGLLVLDLAEEWHRWTGLPFVFALWLVREDAPPLPLPGGVAPFFHRSLEMGMDHLGEIVDEAWRSIGWTKPELREYLTENICYTLGEAERESLALFFDKAVRHGFAPEAKPLRFL